MAGKSKSSGELFADLSELILAQPVATLRARVDELRTIGDEANAVAIEREIAEREARLSEAYAKRAEEEAAAHAAAVAGARAEFDAHSAEYQRLRDESFDHLVRYAEVARPAMDEYASCGLVYQKLLALLGSDSPELPELPALPASYANTGPHAEKLRGLLVR